METLTEKIPALDNLPRTASELGEESELANELREAKTVKDLSEKQLAELAELHASDSRMDTLMAEIHWATFHGSVDGLRMRCLTVCTSRSGRDS